MLPLPPDIRQHARNLPIIQIRQPRHLQPKIHPRHSDRPTHAMHQNPRQSRRRAQHPLGIQKWRPQPPPPPHPGPPPSPPKPPPPNPPLAPRRPPAIFSPPPPAAHSSHTAPAHSPDSSPPLSPQQPSRETPTPSLSTR